MKARGGARPANHTTNPASRSAVATGHPCLGVDYRPPCMHSMSRCWQSSSITWQTGCDTWESEAYLHRLESALRLLFADAGMWAPLVPMSASHRPIGVAMKPATLRLDRRVHHTKSMNAKRRHRVDACSCSELLTNTTWLASLTAIRVDPTSPTVYRLQRCHRSTHESTKSTDYLVRSLS